MSAVVVGVGARTAVGLTARQTAFLLRAGFPAMAEAPLANAAGEPITMGFVPTIDPALTGPERLGALAEGPLLEAVETLGDVPAEVRLALDEGLPDAPVATMLLEGMARRARPLATPRVEARGEAGLGTLLTAALGDLAARRVGAVVVGGVHSDYDPRAIASLEASGRLLSRDNLDARIPGEAAAFIVLMRAADAAARRLPALAVVHGVGTGRERARPDNDLPAYEAFGLTAAVRQATEGLAGGGRNVGWMLTDLTFEMRRQYEWQSVWVRTQNVLGEPYVIDAPAQRIGYLGAAALPLFVVVASLAWAHGHAPSPLALAVAGNDGGDRAAVLLGKAQTAKEEGR